MAIMMLPLTPIGESPRFEPPVGGIHAPMGDSVDQHHDLMSGPMQGARSWPMWIIAWLNMLSASDGHSGGNRDYLHHRVGPPGWARGYTDSISLLQAVTLQQVPPPRFYIECTGPRRRSLVRAIGL